MKNNINITALACAAASVLTACSSSVEPMISQEKAATARPSVDTETRRIASLLSVSDAGTPSAQTPQFAAFACSLAVTTLQAKLANSNILSDEQNAALKQIKTTYDRKARANLSDTDFRQLKQKVEAELPNEAQRARLAIGCVRDYSSEQSGAI